MKRRQNNEAQLEKELGRFFKRLKKSVLKELNEYWSDYQLLQGQVNLMLSPIHEAHKEYYEIIKKYKLREYQLGKAEAKRLTKRANKDRVALKAATTLSIQGFIDKDKNNLFGTIPKAEEDLLNRTFRTSENTLNRVDNQLNQIISDGYREGKGINKVANDITQRFDQLATWEARRIARTEINTSHNQATRDQYKEDGVEYTQWIAANDDRTRDSHAEVDGEIIPIDGKYSNGLAFPGDTSGPLEEWINCRCSNAPFVIPYGFMAPSFSPFRESDLVPINNESLAEPSVEQLEQNLTTEQRAQYEQYTKAVEEAKAVIDSKFSLPRERLQARTQLEYNLSKLNQLKMVANGELARGYQQIIGAVTTKQTNPEQEQTPTEASLLGDIDMFRLTSDEWGRYNELKSQLENGGLKFKLKKEFKSLQKQFEMDQAHRQLVKQGKLEGFDASKYMKKYNDPFIQEKFNLEEMKDTSHLEGKVSPQTQRLIETYGEADRFELTPEEIKQYNELKPKAEAGELGFLDRMDYENLQDQMRLDELHKKLIKNGKLNETEAKGYKELYGSVDIQEKFGTSVIKDTNQIQGIKPKSTSNIVRNPTPVEPEIPYAPKTKEINGKTYTNFTEDTSVILDKQIAQQKKNGYTRRHIDVVHEYGFEGHKDISGLIFNVPELKTGLKTDAEIRRDIEDLEKAINKGKGLEENTTLFRGGEIPEGLKPGDEFVVEGFQSYSFDEDVARDFKEDNPDRFLITSHAEKGSKGIHIDDEMFMGLSEDEWLTQKGQKHRVISVDYEKQTLETEFVNDW